MNNIFHLRWVVFTLLLVHSMITQVFAQSYSKMMQSGSEAYSRNEIQRAIYFYREASSIQPEEPKPYLKLIKCAVQAGKTSTFIWAYKHLSRIQMEMDPSVVCLCHLFDPVSNLHIQFFNELYRQQTSLEKKSECIQSSYLKYLKKTNQQNRVSAFIQQIDFHSRQHGELKWIAAEYFRSKDINKSIELYKQLLTHTDFIDLSLLRLSELFNDKYARYQQIDMKREADKYLQLYLNRKPK